MRNEQAQKQAQPTEVDTANPESTSLLSDTAFLENLRRQMIKFATLQLSDAHLAEDAVQEALIGAMKKRTHSAGVPR